MPTDPDDQPHVDTFSAPEATLGVNCVRALMERHGLPKYRQSAWLAEATGLSYSQAHRKMTGVSSWSIEDVARVAELFGESLVDVVSHDTPRTSVAGTMQVGTAHEAEVLLGKTPTALTWKLANKLLFSKVRIAMGGEVKYFISGGAPLGRELAEWYAKIGIRIHEGYGLTETSPVIALNNPDQHRLGTVGPVLSNLEVKIAADGEILVRGPSVFKGYWNLPAETAQAFEGDWFKTGDVGNLDADGYLSITDRKKDLIKTSGGKFIAPQPIEGSLKVNPLVAEAALVGEKRRFPAVMILPNFALLEEWAKKNAVDYEGRDQLCGDPRVIEMYTQIVDEVNGRLAQYEKMKKLLILPIELSIAEGTMTASMKMRRRHLEAKFHDRIEAMYASESGVPERVAAN